MGGPKGCISGSSDPLLLYLDFAAIYCIDNAIAPDIHSDTGAVLKNWPHVITNFPINRIKVLSRRNSCSGGLELVPVKEVTG